MSEGSQSWSRGVVERAEEIATEGFSLGVLVLFVIFHLASLNNISKYSEHK